MYILESSKSYLAFSGTYVETFVSEFCNDIIGASSDEVCKRSKELYIWSEILRINLKITSVLLVKKDYVKEEVFQELLRG